MHRYFSGPPEAPLAMNDIVELYRGEDLDILLPEMITARQEVKENQGQEVKRTTPGPATSAPQEEIITIRIEPGMDGMALVARIEKETGIPGFLINLTKELGATVALNIKDMRELSENLLNLAFPLPIAEEKKRVTTTSTPTPTVVDPSQASDEDEDKVIVREVTPEVKAAMREANVQDLEFFDRLVGLAKTFNDVNDQLVATSKATALSRDVVGIIGAYLRVSRLSAKQKDEVFSERMRWNKASAAEHKETVDSMGALEKLNLMYVHDLHASGSLGRPYFQWEATRNEGLSASFTSNFYKSDEGVPVAPAKTWTEADHAERVRFFLKAFDQQALANPSYRRQFSFAIDDFVQADMLTFAILSNTNSILASKDKKFAAKMKPHIEFAHQLIKNLYQTMSNNFHPTSYKPGGIDVSLAQSMVMFSSKEVVRFIAWIDTAIQFLGKNKTSTSKEFLGKLGVLKGELTRFSQIYSLENLHKMLALRQDVLEARGEKIEYVKPKSRRPR